MNYNYIQMMGMDAVSRQRQREEEIKRHKLNDLLFWAVWSLGGVAAWMALAIAAIEMKGWK